MATQAEQIAAEQQRRHIPAKTLINFDALTNDELDWLSKDNASSTETRTFAGWELEYREAFGIVCFLRQEDGEFIRAKA